MVAPWLSAATVFSTAGGNCSRLSFFSWATATAQPPNTNTATAMLSLIEKFIVIPFHNGPIAFGEHRFNFFPTTFMIEKPVISRAVKYR
jgi:hypothetical protein